MSLALGNFCTWRILSNLTLCTNSKFRYLSHQRAANAHVSLHKCMRTRLSLRCSHTRIMDVDEGSDKKFRPLTSLDVYFRHLCAKTTCAGPAGVSLPDNFTTAISAFMSFYICVQDFFSNLIYCFFWTGLIHYKRQLRHHMPLPLPRCKRHIRSIF